MSLPKTITFDADVTPFVLKAFNYDVILSTGIIVDKDGNPVLGLDDKPVHLNEFAGIVNTKSGPRLVRNDIVDLIQVSDIIREKA